MKNVPTWVWVVVAGFAAWFYVQHRQASGGVLGSSVGVQAGPIGARVGLLGSISGSEPKAQEEEEGVSSSGGEGFPSRAYLPGTILAPNESGSERAYAGSTTTKSSVIGLQGTGGTYDLSGATSRTGTRTVSGGGAGWR